MHRPFVGSRILLGDPSRPAPNVTGQRVLNDPLARNVRVAESTRDHDFAESQGSGYIRSGGPL
jgi:hypothetical protein